MPVCRSVWNRPGQAVAAEVFFAAMACLAFFLAALPVPASTWAAGIPQATATLPYGGNVSRETVRSFVQNEAWLAALRQAAGKLESRTVVQLGATTRDRRMALAAAVFPSTFRFSPDSDTPEGELTAAAQLTETPNLPSRLRTALRHPEVLALYAAATDTMRKHAAEGRDLLLRAAEMRHRHGPEADHIFSQRIDFLANSLNALHIYVAVLEQLRGKWSKPAVAARELRRAVTLDKNNALLWCALGEAQLQQDLPQAALGSLDKAVALMPGLARARYFRGLTQLRLQQSALAEADLTAALKLRPDMPQWLRTRGAIRMVREDYGPMCEDFNKACMLGDCDGLEAARKRSQCLPAPTSLPAPTMPENLTADVPLPPQPSLPQEQTAIPESVVPATAQAPLSTSGNEGMAPPMETLKKQHAPASTSAPAPVALKDWPAVAGPSRRSTTDSATDAPFHGPALSSPEPVRFARPTPTAPQTAPDSPQNTADVKATPQADALAPAPAPVVLKNWPAVAGPPRRSTADSATGAPFHGPALSSPEPVRFARPTPTAPQTAPDSPRNTADVKATPQADALAPAPAPVVLKDWPAVAGPPRRSSADSATGAP